MSERGSEEKIPINGLLLNRLSYSVRTQDIWVVAAPELAWEKKSGYSEASRAKPMS